MLGLPDQPYRFFFEHGRIRLSSFRAHTVLRFLRSPTYGRVREVGGRSVSDCRVEALLIVEPVEVLKDLLSGDLLVRTIVAYGLSVMAGFLANAMAARGRSLWC